MEADGRYQVKKPKLRKLLFIPDCHHPNVSESAWSLMLRVASYFKPDDIAILGDFADAETLSAHAPTKPGIRDFEDELESVKKALDQLDALGATNKIYVSGNHEFRLDRYMMENAPGLYRSVQWQSLLDLKERGWTWVPYRKSIRLGKLHITHDVGSAGMNAHRVAARAFGGSAAIGHCLPVGYEVLTTSGFVKLADIQIGDTVLSYKDGAVEYVPVEDKVEWDYVGPMAVFDNNIIAQRMTSEHHIFTRDGRYVPVQEALNCVTKADIVRNASPLLAKGVGLSDDWLRLVVAYAADGSRSSAGSLRFHIKKERKVERLTALWESVGGTMNWAAPGANGGRKTVGLDRVTQLRLLELCPDKQLPTWMLELSAEQRQVVVDELTLWDGSRLLHDSVDYGSKQFCSFKKGELDLVQLLLMQHGIRSTRAASGTVISFNTADDRRVDAQRTLSEFVRWEDASERVGCISTRNKNFFVRTLDGSIELTGNTHRLAYEVTGRFDGPPYLAAMFGWLGDAEKAGDYLHEAKASDWCHGIGLGYAEPSGIVHVTPVPFINGRCVVEGKLFD
jgi:hypothetical protein